MSFINRILAFMVSILLFPTSTMIAQYLCGPYNSDENTVLLMHFDGDLTNTYGNSGNGLQNGNGVSFNANSLSHLGQCLSLDNSNSTNKGYISVPPSISLNLSESWTIEAWVYFNSFGIGDAANPTIVSKAESDNFNYFLWYHNSWGSAKGRFTNSNNDAVNTAVGNNTISTGQWYHIAYIRDNEQHTHKLVKRNSDEERFGQNEYQFSVGSSVPILNAQELLIGSLQKVGGF